MSFTNIPPPDGELDPWYLRSRLVDYQAGSGASSGSILPVYVASCGQAFCDSVRFQGRLVDYLPGAGSGSGSMWPVYAAASECRHRKPYYNPEFVAQLCWPPFGITDRVRVTAAIFGPQVECFVDTCPETELVWNGSAWVGTLATVSGEIDLELVCNGVEADPPFTLWVTGDCVVADEYEITILPSCLHPFKAGGGAPIAIEPACCNDEPQPDAATSITFQIWGYTLNRFQGRLVDYLPGAGSGSGSMWPVYVIGECCYPVDDCLIDQDCCGCEASPINWLFLVTGVANEDCGECDEWNRFWVVSYRGQIVCRWDTGETGICTPGDPWRLTCIPEAGVWRLETTNFGGGAATYETPIEEWNCLAGNVMTRVLDHGGCTGFPATISVAPA